MSDEREGYTEDVLRAVGENHLWLNAFSCIRPTEKFAAEVGFQVIRMLKERDRLINVRCPLLEGGREQELILRINQS